MRVAIAHDYLTQRGGAERVLLSMLGAFPDAPLHTSLYRPTGTFPAFASADVRTLPIDRFGLLRRHHRLAFPFLASSFSSQTVDADVVLCSSSGWAHGIRTTGRKVVYCYSPARWLYYGDTYLGGGRKLLAGPALAAARAGLVRWDRRNAASAGCYLTSSTVVRDRIQDTYGIEAEVLPPPHSLDTSLPQRAVPTVEPGFFLIVARLLAYKNVGTVVSAFDALADQRLVVVGTGPEIARLRRLAGPNVTFAGQVHDDELRWLYANCTAVISAGYEDYGLTPIEAAAFGRPAVVLAAGGFLDTVVEGETGVFFEEPCPAAVAGAVREVLATSWSEAAVKAHAGHFGEAAFRRRLRQVVLGEKPARTGDGRVVAS
ncbi:MAG: glycosyltransferase [Acidimicrobiales bacterium]